MHSDSRAANDNSSRYEIFVFEVDLTVTYILDSNVHCYAVDGTSDDLDVPIKAVFSDPDYVKQNNLCSINSINWARILVQISHFVYCYLQLADTVGDTVTIVCPTGACGNITCE